MRGWLVAGVWLAGVMSAQAAPEVYACEMAGSPTNLVNPAAFDQFMIDAEAQVMELRVAKSIGTSKPTVIRMEKTGDIPFMWSEIDGAITASFPHNFGVSSMVFLGDTVAYAMVTPLFQEPVGHWSCER